MDADEGRPLFYLRSSASSADTPVPFFLGVLGVLVVQDPSPAHRLDGRGLGRYTGERNASASAAAGLSGIPGRCRPAALLRGTPAGGWGTLAGRASLGVRGAARLASVTRA